jgi:multidrug efflux system outer membrane protein
MKKAITVLSAVLFLSGCSLAPDFMLPETPPVEAFKEAAGTWKEGEPQAHVPRGKWWAIYNDATLDRLQAQAAEANQTVAAMAARVEQARETANVATREFWPSASGDVSATRRLMGQGTMPGAKAESVYGIGLGIGYELDLFGRVRNTVAAARSDADASASTLESMRLAMQADVAETYFLLRALDKEVDLLEQTLTIREDSLKILQKRLDIGAITELDTSETTVNLEITRSQLHAVRQQRKEAEHALAVLLGQAPSSFALEKAPLADSVPVVPAGLPSALLERRPDISAAQHGLMAANARIGIARAAFFPSISLTGSGGLESTDLSDLFQWSARHWAFGPLASIPVFSGGASVANSRRAGAAYDEAVANYRQQVLVAFRDVEDSLSRIKTFGDQTTAQQIAQKAALRAAELAEKRYDNGDVGYLESITAKQNALDVQRSGIQLQGARLRETVRLIRALGGGWEKEAE